MGWDARESNWGTGQHRQPPQLLEPPSDTVCDPVKLRMLEDIDDSKPHTWTSQSRSFRKLARLVGANSRIPMGPAGAQWSSGECQDLAEVLPCARSPLEALPCAAVLGRVCALCWLSSCPLSLTGSLWSPPVPPGVILGS
ncbi:hypothetical protein IHE44_0003922 [Lamprotornis superbus]|uniref:Uncharacterized protein n=1 Tax=Lamprotornis superbus TaxID=245042 RepID=A0A835NW13_9PASS|nr:hypothetical protein IHE44_0003922 [Lamprotornis superbus]